MINDLSWFSWFELSIADDEVESISNIRIILHIKQSKFSI